MKRMRSIKTLNEIKEKKPVPIPAWIFHIGSPINALCMASDEWIASRVTRERASARFKKKID